MLIIASFWNRFLDAFYSVWSFRALKVIQMSFNNDATVKKWHLLGTLGSGRRGVAVMIRLYRQEGVVREEERCFALTVPLTVKRENLLGTPWSGMYGLNGTGAPSRREQLRVRG